MVRSPHRSLADLHHVAGGQRNTSDLLHPSVGIEEHWTNGRDRRIIPHRFREGLDPTGFDEGVVVQEDDVVTVCEVDANVVPFTEKPVLTDFYETETAAPMPVAQNSQLPRVRAVVDDDDLPDQIAVGP